MKRRSSLLADVQNPRLKDFTNHWVRVVVPAKEQPLAELAHAADPSEVKAAK